MNWTPYLNLPDRDTSVWALFSKGFDLCLDLISLKQKKNAPSLESQGTLLSCQPLQNMSYGWTKGSLMWLAVPVTYHVIEKWTLPQNI